MDTSLIHPHLGGENWEGGDTKGRYSAPSIIKVN